MDSLLLINHVVSNYYFMFAGFFFVYLLYRILHSHLSGNDFMQTRYSYSSHTWRSIQCNKANPYNIYCYHCGKLMLPTVGLFCDCCAISACKPCRRIVNKKTKCKQITWPEDKPFLHHWVYVASSRRDSVDATEEGLKKYFCSWCQRSKWLRETCVKSDVEECDFQKYKNRIIPPHCVQMVKKTVVSIKPLPDEDWEPLIIFANRKSGSNKSDEVLSLFRGILNPIQVVDLCETPPEAVARWLPARARVLAAGGDGTAAWVLNALRDCKGQPAVGVLPLGTGNDLARVLGWAAVELDAHRLMRAVDSAVVHDLDRWKVTITQRGRRRELACYNYCSVGVDAQVALDFHRARAHFLYKYASRTVNYIAYALLGAGRALDDGCAGLERRLRVHLGAGPGAAGPGAALQLPPLQALVLLNIPSWGAGLDLWSMGSEDDVGEQSICDGKLEVVGVSSSFHIARLQCGLAEPYRFAQAGSVKMELSGPTAMQVDGEPWMQRAAGVRVTLDGRCRVLRLRDT